MKGLPPLLYLATLAPLITSSSSLVLLLPFLVRRFFAQHPYLQQHDATRHLLAPHLSRQDLPHDDPEAVDVAHEALSAHPPVQLPLVGLRQAAVVAGRLELGGGAALFQNLGDTEAKPTPNKEDMVVVVKCGWLVVVVVAATKEARSNGTHDSSNLWFSRTGKCPAVAEARSTGQLSVR